MKSDLMWLDPRSVPRHDARFSTLISGCYSLPGTLDVDHYMIPCSGGADSTAMAILLHDLYPDVAFKLFFTDTLAESPELLASLERLEAYLGKPILRIIPEKGLYQKIDEYNGFLPNSNSRWCTRELKLIPYEQYVGKLRKRDETIYAFVGIRADEPERTGLVSREDHIQTELPFKALGIGRDQVFHILERTISAPRFYYYRTRSGCGPCPFQRKAELVGLLQYEPDIFATGQRYEKLTEADLHRFPENAVQLEQECGVATNWLTLPVPPDVDAATAKSWAPIKWGKTPKNGAEAMPLFGGEAMATLWVGAEFFVNPAIGGTGVWWQRIVSFSTTKAGIQAQLQSHYEHRIQTPEVLHRLTVDEMKQELKLAYYLIQVPQRLMDTGKVAKGSYVWSGDRSSYSRLKHLYLWARRALHAEGMKRELQRYKKYRDKPLSWGYEHLQSLESELSKLGGEVGEVLGMARFDPVDAIHEEYDDRKVACFMCSI